MKPKPGDDLELPPRIGRCPGCGRCARLLDGLCGPCGADGGSCLDRKARGFAWVGGTLVMLWSVP